MSWIKLHSVCSRHLCAQAIIEKASIDEVYMDVTSMVEKELRVGTRQPYPPVEASFSLLKLRAAFPLRTMDEATPSRLS